MLCDTRFVNSPRSAADPIEPRRRFAELLNRIENSLIGTVLPNGFAQITPRGSTMLFDDESIALWERGKGTTTKNLADGTPVTIFMRKPALRETGILPKGGILRLYGRAKIHKSGAVYEEIWNRLIEAEKKGDPEERGYAVLVTIERAEDLSGQPLT